MAQVAEEGERITYGPHPLQYVDLWAGDRAVGTVLLVHGGFWRDEHGSDSLIPLALGLARGAAVAGSAEYRHVTAGGPWPTCADDVVAACRAVLAWSGFRPPLVLVGHSAGGHLALITATRVHQVDGVVGLAPVTDLAAAARDDLGSGAVLELLCAGDSELDLVIPNEASPARLPAPSCHVALVHGTADQAIPLSQSQALVEAWPRTRLHLVQGARHMHLVKPERPAWDKVTAVVAAVLADAGTTT